MRQLIANGKFKAALESARQFHKSKPGTASEALLLDAYAARIQSLLDQNLTTEAKSLLDLVRERFPAAKARLDGLVAATSARGGDLSGLLQPLNDPALGPERRTAIEQIIQTQISDLGGLADCPALPPEHSLRQAARALDRAFNLVTSGTVTDEQIVLPEVSHRSPLGPWKLLIRAIAYLHRGDDEHCRELLAAIKPQSVPSRLIPAMRAILDGKTSGPKQAGALNPAEVALVSRINVNMSDLRAALANLDRAFSEGEDDGRIFKKVRAVVRECQKSAPDRLEKLKQFVFVRCAVAGLDDDRLTAALEGAPQRDAAFFRMYARAMESSDDAEDLAVACALWDEFRLQAVKEGWFRANGVEVATLYLHMADHLKRLPAGLLKGLQRSGGNGRKVPRKMSDEDRYFYFPEKLYARACAMDPHPEAFSKWMRWAAGRSVREGENVAQEWHRIRRDDVEPLFYLMEQAEKRNAFPTALSYLEKAERIDAVHSVVRAARLRLLAAGAMRHLQQKKPHLAAEKLAAMAALPQSQQGNRPAFLAALRHLICVVSGDQSGAAEARLEVERLLGGRLAAAFLIHNIAAVSKRADSTALLPVKALGEGERLSIPQSLAIVIAAGQDLGITKIAVPIPYLDEAEKQFPRVSDTLDVEQLISLGKLGMATERPELAWDASSAGLKRGGSSEALFLLMRARAMPPGGSARYLALSAAAAELGRFHRNMEVVDQAVEIGRNTYGGDPVSLTIEQAREVVRKELASPDFPEAFGAGPDYGDMVPNAECQCPDCRRKRGELPGMFDEDDDEEDEIDDDFGEFDEDDLERVFRENAPKGLPPGVSRMLFEIARDALMNGDSPDEFMARIEGMAGKQKKGKRK